MAELFDSRGLGWSVSGNLGRLIVSVLGCSARGFRLGCRLWIMIYEVWAWSARVVWVVDLRPCGFPDVYTSCCPWVLMLMRRSQLYLARDSYGSCWDEGFGNEGEDKHAATSRTTPAVCFPELQPNRPTAGLYHPPSVDLHCYYPKPMYLRKVSRLESAP